MESALKIALFDGTLSTERGSHCAVGTVICEALGFRVRDWHIVTDAHRKSLPIPEGYEDLATMLDNSIGLDRLVAIEDAFNIDAPLLDRVRNVLRRVWNMEHLEVLSV